MTSKSKVICFGLGRTGTASIMVALDHLGFGPCYHMKTILHKRDPSEIDFWYNLGQSSATIDDMREHLKNYNSILDYPCVVYYDKLYQAYPDAKFILTTRDPVKWATSMNDTILPAITKIKESADSDPFMGAMSRWFTVELCGKYHQNKLFTSSVQEEILHHNQRVIDIIPAEQLLVYEVSQGWAPLVKFLGVDKPDISFPHVNDTAEFRARLSLGGKGVEDQKKLL